MNKRLQFLVFVFFALLVSGSVVFAAVKLVTNEQKIKTLKATFTYQDFIDAPVEEGAMGYLKIADLPANTQILSAFVKVVDPFLSINGEGMTVEPKIKSNEKSIAHGASLTDDDSLSDGSLFSGYISNADEEIVLRFNPQEADRIVGGKAKLFVNYIEH